MYFHFLLVFVASNIFATGQSETIVQNITSFSRPKNNKVVGGDPALLGDFPFQLSLQYNGRHFCGAVFIKPSTQSANSVAVTAAHCVRQFGDSPPSVLTVMAGSVSLESSPDQVQILGVKNIVSHPNYGSRHNDIAILFLDGTFQEKNTVKPVGLPEQGEDYNGKVAVSGWGLTEESASTISNHLRFTKVPIVPNEDCAVVYGGSDVITESNLCAGLGEGGKDTCQGDSGGPCVSDTEPKILLGITSWGLGCARPGFPGVYTRVSYYMDWIMETIQA